MEDCIYLVLALGWTKEVPMDGNRREYVLAARRGIPLPWRIEFLAPRTMEVMSVEKRRE
jgi:hypothetical protein